MKKLIAALVASCFSLGAFAVQSTDTISTDTTVATTTKKPTYKRHYKKHRRVHHVTRAS